MAIPKWVAGLVKSGLGDIVNRVHYPKMPKERLLKWAEEHKVEPARLLRAYDFMESVSPHLGGLLDSGEAGMIRDDLFEVLFAFMLEDPEAKNVLDLMHGILPEDQYEMIQIAIAADNLRSEGQDAEAKLLVSDAFDKFGPDARKINALYAARYILTEFAWQLSLFRALDPKTAPQRFRRWFDDQLKFFEQAIFVNEYMEKDEIWAGIAKRVVDGKHPLKIMRLWVAGVDNIRKTVEAVEGFIKAAKKDGNDFDYMVKRDFYGKAVAVEFVVFRTIMPGMKRSRLPMMWEKDT